MRGRSTGAEVFGHSGAIHHRAAWWRQNNNLHNVLFKSTADKTLVLPTITQSDLYFPNISDDDNIFTISPI